MGETKKLALVKENNSVDSLGPESHVDSSNGLHVQNLNGYSYSQGAEDYNQLLSQYYELEDNRQRILQQLQQFGGYNYQCPAEGSGSGSGVHWGIFSTSQDQSVAASRTSLPSFVCSCCPYASPCSLAPCSSFPVCSLGGTCSGRTCTDSSTAMGLGKPSPLIDGDVVKTAMAAAEGAISSMKMKTSANSGMEGTNGFSKIMI